MIQLLKYFLKLLGFYSCLTFAAVAQEEKDDPLNNFDGSNQEITEADPEAQKDKVEGESGSGKVSLGELSKDNIKQDKMVESLENELESENAKGDKTEELIQSALEKMQLPLSASGLELNQPEIFPADI